MKEEKHRKLEACKREVRGIVEAYIDKEGKSNTGQLKFLSGLLTGNLAVSIGNILKKDGRFQKYLEDNFLKDRQAMFSYFDSQRNLEEFVKSPYGLNLEMVYADFCPEFEMPPYILLRRAQEVMERECMAYLRISREGEDEKELPEEYTEEDRLFRRRQLQGRTEKKDAYIDWLFSMAIYEIFLIEYGRRLPKFTEKERDRAQEELETLEKLYPEIFSCSDQEKRDEQIEEFCRRARTLCRKLEGEELVVLCRHCFFRQLLNLCAMLRIIALIEYVRVSLQEPKGEKGRKREQHETARVEAELWFGYASDWKNCYLFTTTRVNHNLSGYVNKFQELYQKYGISPHLSREEYEEESAQKFFDNKKAVLRYLHIIKKRGESREPENLERDLWEAAMPFSMPMIKALDEIGQLK